MGACRIWELNDLLDDFSPCLGRLEIAWLVLLKSFHVIRFIT